MLQHYILIAIRNLLKYKQQSLISIIGLAVGVTCFAFCSYSLRVSMNWDRDIKDIDRIYLLYSQSEKGPEVCDENYASEALTKDFPEIESFVSYSDLGPYSNKLCEIISEDSTVHYFPEIFPFADSCFLDFFQLRLINGDRKKIAQTPGAILLTEKTAYKLFGTIDVVGKTFIHIDDFEDKKELFTIQGVIENFPKQSSLERFSGLELNTTNSRIGDPESYLHYEGFNTFIKLKKGVDPKLVNEKLKSYTLKFPRKNNQTGELNVQIYPLAKRADLYKKGNYDDPKDLFFIIGLLVLLTALFNYVIFIIGRITTRIKECGIRQVNGSSRFSLFMLLFTEASIAFIIASFLSFMISELIIPYTNSISLYFSLDPLYIQVLLIQYSLLGLVGIALICLLVIYKISKISVRQCLFSTQTLRQNNLWRNLFISIQLVICFLFMGATWFVKQQSDLIEYRLTNGLSETDKTSIFEVSLNGDKLTSARQDIMRKLQQNPFVETISRNGMGLSGAWYLGVGRFTWEGLDEQKSQISLGHIYTDANYFDLINTKAKEGRLYTMDETNKAVINESFARLLSSNPTGMEIGVDYWQKGMVNYQIVGIIPDVINNPFNLNTKPIIPCIYMPYPEEHINLTCIVKVKPQYRKEFPNMMKAELLKYVNQATPVYINSMKEHSSFYLDYEQNLFQMTFIFSIICVLISLLGIYASVVLSTERRKKEVAIRKINGATSVVILSLFAKSNLIQLIISAIIAFPILILFLNKWLENYSTRITISILPFILLFLLIAIIVAFTIIWQLWRIARINPAEVIKSE